jgi:AcrR family transcriptional regulator
VVSAGPTEGALDSSPDDPSLSTRAKQAASITVRRLAQTRRELTAAAARLFIERGYEATTVADIAAAAGISPRTFFRYFAAKEQVVNDALGECIAVFSATLDARPADEPLLESLRAAGGVTLAKTLEKGVMELFAVMRPTPPLRAQWLALCNAYTEQIADSLGRRLGATQDPMVADLAAGALVGMVANVLDHVSELSSGQLAHILDESFAYFVNGFGSRA